MESLDLPAIVEEVKERQARSSTANSTPDDAAPVSVPLRWIEWADDVEPLRVPTLAKLCATKPEVDELCSTCTKEGISRCRAYGVRYCSASCQERDWKRHKVACQAFSKWDYSTRPSDDHFLALVFPTDRKEPELLWCRLTDNATMLETAHPDVYRLRHRIRRGHAAQINASLSVGRMYLGHGLALLDVYGLGETEKDGLLNVNQCVSALAAPGALGFHAGPHLVFSFVANNVGEPSKGIDVVPRDWRHATDFIILNKFNASLSVLGLRPAQMATRLNNTASLIVSQIHHIKEPIENVIAPIAHFPGGGPCAAAFQLGLPWRVRCILASEQRKLSNNMKYLAPYLHRRLRADGTGVFEWTTCSQYPCGSIILLAAGNDRVVHQHHVTALNKYLDFSLKRRITPSKKGFIEYWDKYATICNQRGQLMPLGSPYHYLPPPEELVIYPGDSNQYRSAMMNLLGHFFSKDFVMQVKEVNGELVPIDVVAPFDSEAEFRIPDEAGVGAGVSFGPFGTALKGTRKEEARGFR